MERCWGVLEAHWNGALLDTVEAVVEFAKTMTWKAAHPTVCLVTKLYESGEGLAKKAMEIVERRLVRHPSLPSWFIDIRRQASG